MAKVSKRGGFSDRNAIKPENNEIQLTEFDKRTRIQLQNMISELYSYVYNGDLYYGNKHIQDYLKYIQGTVYAEPVDTRKKIDDSKIIKMINNTISNDDYDDVLTLIEAIIQHWDLYLQDSLGYGYYNRFTKQYDGPSIYDLANIYLKREYIGYRFVDGIIVPISDEFEIAAINEAVSNKFAPVNAHITKANRLLADREKPDYENSIKESISAVEAMCELITGIKGKEATLGKLLKVLEDKGVVIHGSLKSAFNTLYGYASDANGIRHAGDIGGPLSTFEEAKFMLVTCSAFINYLTAICAEH